MSFGQRLKTARNNKKLTQSDVSKNLGIDFTTISKYENNKSEPDNETLLKLAKLYNVSPNWLLTGEESTEPKEPYYALTEKDEKDIAKDLERMMNDLESKEGMAFYGEPLDEEDRELLKISLENSLRLARQMAKKKFTPKKYRN